MERRRKTRTWLAGLVLLVFAGGLAAFLAWESRGRSGTRRAALSLPDEAVAHMAVYERLCGGKKLAGEGKHAEALAIFEELVRTEGGSDFGWDADIQAAASMGCLGQHEDSLSRLDRIVANCPLEEEVCKARMAKAEVLSLAGEHDAAVRLYNELIKANTNKQPRMCEEALIGMTVVYARTEQPGLVRAALDWLITDYPGAEDTRRRWAQGKVASLRSKTGERQSATIGQLLAEKKATRIDDLGAGISTWTAEGGPYLVVDPLVIQPGAVLRIEAGTVVRFGVSGGLEIAGVLELKGTADGPVSLVPLSDDPSKDWWVGIKLQTDKGQTASRLAYCRVVGAEIGVDISRGRVEMDHCRFDRCGRVSVKAAPGTQLDMSRCEIEGGHRIGVECGRDSHLAMTDCRISDLTTHGVLLEEVADGSFIRRTGIEQCGWDGLLVRGRCSPMIDECKVLGNGGNGVRATEGASPTVLNTRVARNSAAGINLEGRWNAVIRGSTIADNSGGGVVAEVRCNGEIMGNRIEGNESVGMNLRLGCTPTVTHNGFIGNKGVGLLLENSRPETLRNNQFIANSEAALRNEGSATVQAAQNWWGTTSESEIAEMIQDKDSNPDWGEVEFKPWLAAPPAMAGAPSASP